jgi:TRAP-type mannitol/chloroaromatic compound transport system permease small subunit
MAPGGLAAASSGPHPRKFSFDGLWRVRLNLFDGVRPRPSGQRCTTDGRNGAPRRLGGTPVNGLLALSRAIDTINFRFGKILSWLLVVAILLSTANAIVRKLFDISSNSWLELQWVLFSAVFLMCAPWTLLDNEHIRIDIINGQLPQRARNWIDVIGHAFFLLPLTIIMIVTGVPFFLKSWEINEQSGNAGGLPQWPAKSLLAIGFTFLMLQAISELIKRIAVMRGRIPDPYETGGSHAAIEAETERVISNIHPKQ